MSEVFDCNDEAYDYKGWKIFKRFNFHRIGFEWLAVKDDSHFEGFECLQEKYKMGAYGGIDDE